MDAVSTLCGENNIYRKTIQTNNHSSSARRLWAEETFCAEVEILRSEMQSTEIVVDGEFLSHTDMTEKGFSEHFGLIKIVFLKKSTFLVRHLQSLHFMWGNALKPSRSIARATQRNWWGLSCLSAPDIAGTISPAKHLPAGRIPTRICGSTMWRLQCEEATGLVWQPPLKLNQRRQSVYCSLSFVLSCDLSSQERDPLGCQETAPSQRDWPWWTDLAKWRRRWYLRPRLGGFHLALHKSQS